MPRRSSPGSIAALLMFVASALFFVHGAVDGNKLAILAGGVNCLAGSVFLIGAQRTSRAD